MSSKVYTTTQQTNPIDTTPGGDAHYENDIRAAMATGEYTTGDVIGSHDGGITVVTDTGYKYIPGGSYQIVSEPQQTTTTTSSYSYTSSTTTTRTSTSPSPTEPTPKAPAPPDIQSMPRPMREQHVDVQMYEYATGVYELEGRQAGYHHRGVYVSKPFLIPGNILEVELLTDEKHPFFDIIERATNRYTSTEYYITHRTRPITSDWLPILPKDERTIYNELLHLSSARIAELRFKARPDLPIHVYSNGQLMQEYDWEIYPDYQQVIIAGSKFLASNTYTIDYTPDPTNYDPWLIDFRQEGLAISTATQTAVPDRNGVIYLEKFPYIDYGRTDDADYHPIRVTLKDAHIIGPEDNIYNSALPWHTDTVIATKNITEYDTMKRPAITPYSIEDPIYLTFEYNHKENMLIFGDSFTEVEPEMGRYATGTFDINYDVLTPSVRMKIIMRATSPMVSATPKIDRYTLRFNIVR